MTTYSRSGTSRIAVSLFIILGALEHQASCFAQATAAAGGDTATTDNSLVEIVVTAEKRTERLQDVAMSVTAATGLELQSLGITNTDQLEKLVPGFTVEKTPFGGWPVFFIRGVGFNDTSLGVSPAVTVYMDQIPLPFAVLSRGAILDLERVEVLKGPQGTLFGENSTGGAINYIAAKPTDTFQGGSALTYGRFNEVDTEAFVSGPLSSTVFARLAVRNEYEGDWQKGYTIDETNGQKQFHNGRLLLDWKPSDLVKFEFTASGWIDHSETQQPQFALYTPGTVGPGAQVIPYPEASFPPAPADPRAAAWDPNDNLSQDNHLYQFALRGDINVAEHTTLTFLSSYESYKQRVPTDWSGTPYPIAGVTDDGTISSVFEELRFDGTSGERFKWMLGGNYEDDIVDEHLVFAPQIQTTGVGPFYFDSLVVDNDQRIKSKSGFGSLDFLIVDGVTAQSSVRFTSNDRSFVGCARDSGDGTLAAAIGFLSTLLTGTPQTIQPGACVVLGPTGAPVPIITGDLNQNNVSWRESLNFKPNPDTLLYANVTKGYKGGGFPTEVGALAAEFRPVPQESVLAYELGFKLDTSSRMLRLDGALFYYDYIDKQLDGYTVLPPFGAVPELVSIPKSKVEGAEIAATLHPIRGLTLSVNGTVVDTRVSENPPYPIGPYSTPGDFVGDSFPFSPKWQGVFDAQYSFAVSSSLTAFVGTHLSSRSATVAALLSGATSVAEKEALYRIPTYTFLDLRAGIAPHNGPWRLEIWGRNVTNRFSITGVTHAEDFLNRFTGMPATFGVTANYRFGH